MAETSGHARRPDEPRCYNCGGVGHWAIACPEPTRQTPAGLEAWRSSSSTPAYHSGSRDHRNSAKKSKGPIITKYAPPPSAGPTPGSFPQGPGNHHSHGPGPYPGPHVSYPPHQPQHHPPPYPPPYPPHPPPNDPRYRFPGPPSQPSHPPPTPNYGPPQPYGLPPGPPGYGSHPPPPPMAPVPPPPLPPPQIHPGAPPGYYPSYGSYAPHHGHGAGPVPHPHGYQHQGPPPTPPPPGNFSAPYRKHPPPRPSNRRNSSSKPSHTPALKTHLPAPPTIHSLPPKPPSVAQDRMDRRRDHHRNKKKTDKGDRQRGPRDNRPRDSMSNKDGSSQNHGHQHHGLQEHQKRSSLSGQGSDLADQVTQQESGEQLKQEPESPPPPSKHDGGDDTTKHEAQALPEESKASLNEVPDLKEEDREIAVAQPAQDHVYAAPETPTKKETQSQEESTDGIEDEANEVKEAALVRPTDGADPVVSQATPSPVVAPSPKLALTPLPSQDTVEKDDGIVRCDEPHEANESNPRRSPQESPLKRRRSNDSHDYYPRRASHQKVTESNLRSLEQSHRQHKPASLYVDSPRREQNGISNRSRRRRSFSRDRSREGSPGSSISSRSSGLDSLEAELLGRPAKMRSDDANEPNEKPHDRAPKAKRRRQNLDAAYSRRW